MLNKIKLNKDLLLILVVTTFLTLFLAYVIFNILDMVNPIFAEEECIILTPQLERLLAELEENYK